MSPVWRYRGPLDMPNAAVPGQLGCCSGSLGGGKPPHIPVRSLGGLPSRGSPLLPSPSADLTMVWGTSQDLGCRAAGQESHTDGGSAGQPVPAPCSSPPRGLLPLQHQFASKTVRAPASRLLWAATEKGDGQEERVWGEQSSPPSLPPQLCLHRGWMEVVGAGFGGGMEEWYWVPARRRALTLRLLSR